MDERRLSFVPYAGMRIGDLVNLEWVDIDFEVRKVIVSPKDYWKPEGMEERIIPMQQYRAKVDICQVDVNFSYLQLICWIDMREAGQSDGEI